MIQKCTVAKSALQLAIAVGETPEIPCVQGLAHL